MIQVNMTKARDILRDRLRVERAPLLAALDVEYMRSIERGDADAAAEVVARKQALRDATGHPSIEAAQTPAALAALTLAALAGV